MVSSRYNAFLTVEDLVRVLNVSDVDVLMFSDKIQYRCHYENDASDDDGGDFGGLWGGLSTVFGDEF